MVVERRFESKVGGVGTEKEEGARSEVVGSLVKGNGWSNGMVKEGAMVRWLGC